MSQYILASKKNSNNIGRNIQGIWVQGRQFKFCFFCILKYNRITEPEKLVGNCDEFQIECYNWKIRKLY